MTMQWMAVAIFNVLRAFLDLHIGLDKEQVLLLDYVEFKWH